MLISCEKCATTYVLDDGLIPAQGAPVQCTRCGFVFTARRASPESTPKEPLAPFKPQDQRSSTMMFGSPATGTAAPAAPAAPARSSTMIFGGQAGPVPPVQHDSSTKPTLTSSPGTAGVAKSNQTMMFGAPPVAPAPAAPSAKSTMVFGAVQGPPAAPPPAATASRTMIFGSEAVVPGVPKTSTQMFGAPVAQPQPPPRSSAPRAASQTLVFGRAGEDTTPPEAKSAPVSRTMIFGGPVAEPKPKLSESTMRVDIDEMMREHGVNREGEPVQGGTTPPEPREAVQERHQRTQLFAMRTDAAPEPAADEESDAPPKSRHDRTALFAMSSQSETTKPDAKGPVLEVQEVLEATIDASASARDTLPPDHPSRVGPTAGVLPDPRKALKVAEDGSTTLPPDAAAGRTLMMYGGVTSPDGPLPPISTETQPGNGPLLGTVPQLPPVLEDASRAPLELPPEPLPEPGLASTMPFPPEFGTRGTDPGPLLATDLNLRRGPSTQEAMESMQAPARRRTGLVVGLLLLLVLGIGAALVWKLYGKQLLGGRQTDALVSDGVAEALSRLRRDDGASRTEVHTLVGRLLKQRPDAVELHAVEVMALAFDFDDLRQRATRQERRYSALKARLQTLEQNAGEAARDNAEAVRTQLSGLKFEHDNVAAQANEAAKKLQAALMEMQRVGAAADASSGPGLALLRAQALVRAIYGEPEALTLSERYTTLTTVPDEWVELAGPEYIVNAPTTPESRADALKQLAALTARSENSTFVRPYVLAARIHLAQDDYAAGEEQLEKVIAMRPEHDVARDLLTWTKKVMQEKEKSKD